MAKYECSINGDFNELLNMIDNGILRGSISASYEDGSNFRIGDTACAVRVYERYSAFGNNRVSLSITLFGNGKNLHLSAISSGGSQGIFFKLNTVGENTFLNRLVEIVERYKQERS